ncbi:SLC13 family permease [Thermovibrio sp.]
MRGLLKTLFEEWLFSLFLFLTLLSSLILKRLPRITLDEVEVLFTVFVFLVLINGLREHKVLSFLAYRLGKGRFLALKLVFITGLLSTFVTNDVALMVMVPFTLSFEGSLEKVLIFETLAANGLSAISPVGNPQNIFIYLKYSLTLPQFLKAISPFGIAVSVLLLFLSPKELSGGVEKEVRLKRGYETAVFLFLLFLLSVLKFLPLYFGFIPLLYALFRKRELLKVDYFLLGTFLVFFAFTDNLSHALNLKLDGPLSVFTYSALLSQVMSNVPSALLVSEFTDNWRALLWGVSVGGFGTLVASLANLITYRFYRERGSSASFLLKFHIYNFLFLFVLGVLYLAILKF